MPRARKPKLDEISLPTIGRTGYGSVPDILCRVCQSVKPPGRHCSDCYREGRIYRGREVTNPETRVKLKAKRKEILERAARKVRRRNTSNKGLLKRRKGRRVYATAARVEALKTLLWVCERIMACFERDRAGTLHIYEDRMPELRHILEQVVILIPKVKAAYPTDGQDYVDSLAEEFQNKP